MARKPKRVCLIPPWWTPEEIQTRTCGDGSHKHISHYEAAEKIDQKEAEWIVEDKILRQMRINKALRDRSIKLGPWLAKKVGLEQKKIRLHSEEPDGGRQYAGWAMTLRAELQGSPDIVDLTSPRRKKKSKTRLGRGPRPRMKTFIPGTVTKDSKV